MAKMYKLLILLMLIVSPVLFAQNYTLSGQVTEEATGEPLIGANVYLENTSIGAATDEDGSFEIIVPKGTYTIVVSYIGYETIQEEVDVTANMQLDYEMEEYEFSLSVTVLADRAKERETPVAFTNISKKEMEVQLGSRDIPMILNTTPSVFATPGGGGAGDARINVRGFDQRNTAIMINGVPINDMENGWVYWSNWDGLGDATSSIQMQRGLSAVNLATPSVGGTMNVITDPTQQKASIFVKNEVGSGNFSKTSVFAHTGLVDDKFALSMGVVKKTGEGVIEKTWTDAWAYNLAASYQINKTNRVELYASGAPQRHGQRLYALNAAQYSHELARDLGYSEEILKDPRFQEQGILFNPNWNTITTEYQGNQYYTEYWHTPIQNRYDPTSIMERENYYHKPIVNLNWYSQFSDKFSLYTTAYWSGGKGGGTGTYGSLVYDYSLRQRIPDWNASYYRNIANLDTLDLNGDGEGEEYKISRGVIRNSVNQQWTIGAISKAYIKVSEKFTGSFGVDWRHAVIDHYREVRDLLGGDYFHEYSDNNDFDSGLDEYKYLGDKVDYYNTNTVDWIGGYLQGEYTASKWTLYGTAGYSMIKYDYEDHFRAVNDNPANGKLTITPDWFTGYQVKGGASYRVNPAVDVFANAGYVAKVPIFDQVIDDNTGTEIKDYTSEKFISGEAGLNINTLNNKLNIKTNLYYTMWNDRGVTQGRTNQVTGDEGVVRIAGIDATHMGLELEAAYQPMRFVRFDAALSKGIWEYTKDINAIYVADIGSGEQDTLTLPLDGLKVGNQPQTQFSLATSVFPVPGLQAQLVWQYNTEYYADWDPITRSNANDKAQVWEIPSFHLFDLHMYYTLPVEVMGLEVNVFAHVFNLFNNLYVQDATDNSEYNSYEENGVNHSADDAEIFPGLPRTFNGGFSIRF